MGKIFLTQEKVARYLCLTELKGTFWKKHLFQFTQLAINSKYNNQERENGFLAIYMKLLLSLIF